ncbi:hypothetical protein Heshes_24200 [Alicyclobacillus hesperidum]|uniref:E2 family protein E n=2 Tax=Alicyclobacillus TaxID=29330 RepID=A0A1H2X5V8_9BACL|nr:MULTISPECIES: E2/UBC family protein [Alicyclobacillus]MDP9729686.1 hypothetical protein [Alicyclobacillus tengchongensis]GLV14736.1 hypothetical protein Heshes_24200 [Alicyclobacillus hesperidum]SDW88270.1 E2 family protein E [Alicyclobacillus hesperidum]
MPLLEDDEQYLTEKGWRFEIHEEPERTLLVIKDYQLPSKFTLDMTDVLIIIPRLYPMNPLDMFWVRPEIRLKASGAYPQAADYFENYLGDRWQRFSRHYQWRPNIDSLESHLRVIQNSLERA